MILAIGEILFDIFPEYQRIGGAPFNFSFHLKKIGFPVRFITRIGIDNEGEEILTFVRKHGFDINDIQRDKTRETGKVMVELDTEGLPNFNIMSNAAFDFIEIDESVVLSLDQKPELIYFGSLIQRTLSGFKALQQILTRKPSHTRCLYDLNLRPRCYNREIVLASLKRADLLKLNSEELEILRQMLDGKNHPVAFIDTLRKTYSIDMVAVTSGAKGSELFTSHGRYELNPPRLEHVTDSVGAGDAYSAMLAVGYLQDWPPETILSKATRFAAKICTIEGAIPSEPGFYETLKL